jgi:hypothetical protein
MKRLIIAALLVTTCLTAVEPVLAQSSTAAGSTSRTTVEEGPRERLSDLGMAINPQIGVSNFEYSEKSAGDSQNQLSGGVTVEFGGAPRKVETGLLILQTESAAQLKSGNTSIRQTMLGIPMMAKLRLVSMKAQSWYGKFGVMPAFEMSSNEGQQTNNIDVISTLGIGGRLEFTRKADFVIEATYNRGFLDALRTDGTSHNQGFLVLAGMSFNI